MQDYKEYCPLCGSHPSEQGEQYGLPSLTDLDKIVNERTTKEQLLYWKDDIEKLYRKIQHLTGMV